VRVFIGYDPRQPVAYQVAAHSVWEHASKPVSITRLDIMQLPIKRVGLTCFTFTRFLVPYLCGYEGKALFLDSDVLVRGDVHELADFQHVDDANVAMVMGERRFEWPSVMWFHNKRCLSLTPEFVEKAPMFDMAWAKIAPLAKEWNHLVGYDAPNQDAKIVHFTKGIPIWDQTKGCEFAAEWWKTYERSGSSVPFEALMAQSVHHQKAG